MQTFKPITQESIKKRQEQLKKEVGQERANWLYGIYPPKPELGATSTKIGKKMARWVTKWDDTYKPQTQLIRFDPEGLPPEQYEAKRKLWEEKKYQYRIWNEATKPFILKEIQKNKDMMRMLEYRYSWSELYKNTEEWDKEYEYYNRWRKTIKHDLKELQQRLEEGEKELEGVTPLFY